MSDYAIYGIVVLVGLFLASMAAWKIVLKSKSNKVTAKNGSVAVGRDYNSGDKNRSQN